MPAPIPLTEKFDSPSGKIWNNYDAYETIDRENMAGEKHVDIRSFVQDDETAPRTMFQLSTWTVGVLEGMSMTELEGYSSVGGGENWTVGTITDPRTLTIVGSNAGVVVSESIVLADDGSIETSDLCQNIGIKLTCKTGVWTNAPEDYTDADPEGYKYQWQRDGADITDATLPIYTTVIADRQATLTCIVTVTNTEGVGSASTDGTTSSTDGGTAPAVSAFPTITGWQGFWNDDHIVLSFPSYSSSVVKASCFLDLTSNPTGSFVSGPTASVSWNDSQTPLTNASPSELRFLRSQFNQNGIDLSKITGVRLRILGSAGATSYVMVGGIRLLSKEWQYGGVDIDTRYQRLRKSVPRNGDPAGSLEFSWPILWKSSIPSGTNDPRPIDSEIGVRFFTGTISESNNISLYFREVTADFLTQLDINGKMQSQLNGYDQPDIGTAAYNLRTMADLEAFDQSELDDETQFSLERTPDYLSASWIQILLQWGAGGAGSVSFVTSEGGGYTLPLTTALSNNTNYAFFARCEETTALAKIYSLDSSGNPGTKVFDSNLINDSFLFKRRAGRFGWQISLGDRTAYVDSIRDRYLNFGEYRSLPLRSYTPVDGAELFVGASPNVEKFTELLPGKFNTTNTSVNRATDRSLSGSSWKIVSTESQPLQGVRTNLFSMSDWANSRASFDIYLPSGSNTVKAYLFDELRLKTIELVLPLILNDQWQHIDIDFPTDVLLSDTYSLDILQLSGSPAPWWLDNISVFSRSIAWEGRSVVDDPWKSNNARWTPFHENYNREGGGVIFPRRGNELQIRGRVLRQYAEINRIQFKPKYSQLGRIPILEPTDPTQYGYGRGRPTTGEITCSWISSVPGGYPARTIKFEGTGSSGYGGFISQYAWSFGDGIVAYGDTVYHTYKTAGSYSVNLTVTDSFGYQAVYRDVVGV